MEVWKFVLVVTIVTLSTAQVTSTSTDPIQEIKDALKALRDTVTDLARQTMLQQLFVEERIRSEGDSGVKLIRGSSHGEKNYYSNSHIGRSFDAIHDHSNYDRTIGMGEINVVLNGVDFRTRHNDYKLMMPSTSSTKYHAVEKLPFPEVPGRVTSKATIEEEIEEMRLWFKAFKDQDYSERDYRKYFKPALCYLEGAWTLDKELEEPFESDRHQLDAGSWFELQELVRYSAYTGTKSRLENYAYLPTSIMSVNQTTGLPNYAQWNYRILCSPIDQDIPTRYLKQQDDLSYRLPRQKQLDDVINSRAARFTFYEHDSPKFTKYGLLDEIFYTIPGKDNLPADNLTQVSFGEELYDMGQSGLVKLNTGYYHRWFKFNKPGAMGLTNVARGFNDANLWVAQTTQKRIAPMGLTTCSRQRLPGERRKKKVCTTHYTRFTYALPLEIVYLTPLLSWNPYNLAIHEDKTTAVQGGRNGRDNDTRAYNGTDFSHHYLTPVEFFSGKLDKSDKADTVRNAVWVLDKAGVGRSTTASGTRILLQSIQGVGQVRLRYPIAPVHGEGSSVWKELNALKDFVLSREEGGEGNPPNVVHFEMTATTRDPPGEHTHEFTVDYSSYLAMINDNQEVTVTTTENQGHTHDLTIKYNKRKSRFQYKTCGNSDICWDRHPVPLVVETPNLGLM